MNDKLHPALAEHAMEAELQLERERHRKTWRQLEQARRLLSECIGQIDLLIEIYEEDDAEPEDIAICEQIKADIRAALSQQAEPERCTCPSGDGSLRWPCPTHKPAPANQATDGGRNPRYEGLFEDETEQQRDERLANAKAEPAPAQDERTAFEAWVMQHNTAVREDYDDTDENAPEDIRLDRQGGVYIWANAEAAWFAWKARSALDTRPAQTEQQPEQRNIEPLLNAGAALSNIAFNLAQRPGVTLDQHVCDLLSSARKSWDAARSALPATPSPAMDAKEE